MEKNQPPTTGKSMSYFRLVERDQPRESWLLYSLIEKQPKRQKRPELPSVVSRLLGHPAQFKMEMKMPYLPFRCESCGKYDSHEMFDVGFHDPVRVRIKGDFAHTNDRILIVSETFLRVIQAAKVRGYESKPVGSSGWHALRITELVDCNPDVITADGPICPLCGRSKSAHGLFSCVNQLVLPKAKSTFFTTRSHWPRGFTDRDLFVTEDVVQALKSGGVKGGYCERLLTSDEHKKCIEKVNRGGVWSPPPGAIVRL